MKHLTLDPNHALPATRDLNEGTEVPGSLPDPKETKVHPSSAGGENARLLFVGTATTILYVVFVSCCWGWGCGRWRGMGRKEGEEEDGERRTDVE